MFLKESESIKNLNQSSLKRMKVPPHNHSVSATVVWKSERVWMSVCACLCAKRGLGSISYSNGFSWAVHTAWVPTCIHTHTLKCVHTKSACKQKSAFQNNSVTQAISLIQTESDTVAFNYKSQLFVQASSCLYIDMLCWQQTLARIYTRKHYNLQGNDCLD